MTVVRREVDAFGGRTRGLEAREVPFDRGRFGEALGGGGGSGGEANGCGVVQGCAEFEQGLEVRLSRSLAIAFDGGGERTDLL